MHSIVYIYIGNFPDNEKCLLHLDRGYGQRGRSQPWKAFIVFLGVCRSETDIQASCLGFESHSSVSNKKREG